MAVVPYDREAGSGAVLAPKCCTAPSGPSRRGGARAREEGVPGDARCGWPGVLSVPLLSRRQLMQQVQNCDVPAAAEEQDVSALPVSCAWESGMELHPAACASARINV